MHGCVCSGQKCGVDAELRVRVKGVNLAVVCWKCLCGCLTEELKAE